MDVGCKGFNRELRFAGQRKPWVHGSTEGPPAISAVFLDDVDGDVLDGSPNRVPGSPFPFSPQRLSIPRTPVSGRSTFERPLLDASPTSVPPTPSTTTGAKSVEVLLQGTMRTAHSDWFKGGEAWFPAELLNFYREPPAPQGAFESDPRKGAREDIEQIWVQVRVLILHEQPLFWVKIQAVRCTKPSGVLPAAVGEDVEVCQILDGHSIWYRGRLISLPGDCEGAFHVQLYGCMRGQRGQDEYEGQTILDKKEAGQRHLVMGPRLSTASTPDTARRLRRPPASALSADDAVDMVRALPHHDVDMERAPSAETGKVGSHLESESQQAGRGSAPTASGTPLPMEDLTHMAFDLRGVWRVLGEQSSVVVSPDLEDRVAAQAHVDRVKAAACQRMEAKAGMLVDERVAGGVVDGGGDVTLFADLLCEREVLSLETFAHAPSGFASVFRQSCAAGVAGAEELGWSTASLPDVSAFAKVCLERIDDTRVDVRVEAHRALLVAALGLTGGSTVGWWSGTGGRNVEEVTDEGEREQCKGSAGARARAERVLEEVSEKGSIHILVHSLCRATQYGSCLDDVDASEDEESAASDDSADQDGPFEHSSSWYGGWDDVLKEGSSSGEALRCGQEEGTDRERSAQMMRIEAGCVCNLLFLALLYRHRGPGSFFTTARRSSKCRARSKWEVGHEEHRGVYDADLILDAPAQLAGSSHVPSLLVVLVQLLYRAGRAGTGGGSKAARALSFRFPVPYKKILCLLRLCLSLVLQSDGNSEACKQRSPDDVTIDRGWHDDENALQGAQKCTPEHLRRWLLAMTSKYPGRAPHSMLRASKVLISSLSHSPGLPSIGSNPCVGVEDDLAVGGSVERAGSGWAPMLGSHIEGLDPSTFHLLERLYRSRCGTTANDDEQDETSVTEPVQGVTHRVYGALLDHLPSLVVALLKILLAAGVNATNLGLPMDGHGRVRSSPVNDMQHDTYFDAASIMLASHDGTLCMKARRGRDRWRRGERKEDADSGVDEGKSDEEQGEVVAEWVRYRRVVCLHAPAIVLQLLAGFRRCHHLQFEYLARLLCDSNFLLLALKYLNRDCEVALRLPSDVAALNQTIMGLISPSSRLLSAVPCDPSEESKQLVASVGTESLMGARRCRYSFGALVCVLRVLHSCCWHSQNRVRTLLTYKAPLILRKIVALPNRQLELYALLLYKSMVSQLSRKWKANNCNVLSLMFLKLSPTLETDFRAGDMLTEHQREEEEMRLRHETDRFNESFYAASRHSVKVRDKVSHRVARRLVESAQGLESCEDVETD